MKKFVLVLAAASVSTSAMSAPPVLLPVRIGAETVRYMQGTPTLDLAATNGHVQVTPLGMDHSGVSFSIAVFNGGQAPADFDVSNISVTAEGAPVAVLTEKQLVAKAKNRAMWTTIALAAVGGVAAVAAAGQQTHYRSKTRTPFGTYRTQGSYRSTNDALQTAAIAAGTGAGIAAIQSQLDRTRQMLGNEIIQLTTVGPGDSYAGRIILDKIAGAPPATIQIVVNWNGRQYPFAWQLAKEGTPAPVFRDVPRPQEAAMPAPAFPKSDQAMPNAAVPAQPVMTLAAVGVASEPASGAASRRLATSPVRGRNGGATAAYNDTVEVPFDTQ